MPRLVTALLWLYPRRWRLRYGDEMAAMLEAERLTPRSLTDLIAGAIDARLNPQLTAARVPAVPKGTTMTTRLFRCAPEGVSSADQWRSAGWMLGGTLALTLFGMALRLRIGPNALSEALLYSAFPAALMLSNECTWFRPYSRAARLTMSLGGALFIVLLMWGSVLLAQRL